MAGSKDPAVFVLGRIFIAKTLNRICLRPKIELSPQIKYYAAAMDFGGYSVGACTICSSETLTDGILIDGSVFHTRCLQELKDEAETLKTRKRTSLAELRKPLSFIENISLFLFQSRHTELLAKKRYLASSINRMREDYETTVTRIRSLYDLWPTYPPDWDERRRLVSDRDHHSCAECGVGGMLHLHHVRPLSQGGTNKLDNIVLLCEHCHKEAHGGRIFRYQDRDGVEPTTIEKKISLLNEALAQHKNIHFRYKKPDGTITQRTVTPRNLRKLTIQELQALLGKKVKIEQEGKLCLFGYCHLRRENRTFAVHRMQRIRFR
jgi:5-methylcytosine-specific restriction endonuclease McrA